MTGKLTVGADGRVTGPAQIVHNDPFPCVNGRYGSGQMMGVLMHTTVSEAPSAVSWFNNPQAQASAHFVIAESGEITQMGPIGKGWEAWHAAEANATWYGIEHADNGNPANPLTPAQITASAQLVECLSAFAGFPLQISDSPSVKGYGWHGMGGEAFGGHFACPGDVRKAQRPQIVALAMSIRSGGTVPASPAPPREWLTAGMSSLASLAQQQHTDPATILHLTAAHGAWPADVAAYVNGVFAGTISPKAAMPRGLALYLPG